MATLLAVGTFAVHQLRFAFSGGADSVTGHAYLVALGPVLAGLLLLAAASALRRLARGVADPAPRFRRLWLGASASLFVVYCTQEASEGALTSGHPGGLADGGWVALPLAVAIGLAIALIMRGAAQAARLVRRACWRLRVPTAPVESSIPVSLRRVLRVAARNLAPRGPPRVSVQRS
jgi:hypothetical protein